MRRIARPHLSIGSAAGWVIALALGCVSRTVSAQNQLYVDLTANNATISTDGDGNIIEGGVTYDTVTKPVPPNLVSNGGNEYLPWISTNGGYTSNDAFAYQILPSPSSGGQFLSSADKIDTTLSTGDFSDALTFDSPKYLGFAVNLPAANFTAPFTTGPAYTGVQIAQWWQGAPYGPPLALELVGESNGMAQYNLVVHNDMTDGNPSSVPDTVWTGTLPFDSWNTFVVMTDMDYSGNGEIELWQNGNLLTTWTGVVGYDPSGYPYDLPTGINHPNQKFNVYFGPYRPGQDSEQEELFDDVRWANDFGDAVPVPQAEVVLNSTSALTVPTDGDIGGSLSSGLEFSGGSLSVTSSFTTGRAVTIGSGGGTINVASHVTFGFGNSLNWQGGTLNLTGSGTTAISQSSGSVSVLPGSTLSISANSKLTVGGSVDPFTDSATPVDHVAIVNNGSMATNLNTTVASITGSGSLTVVSGGLQLASGGGTSTASSLTVVSGGTFDITNNAFVIDYIGSSPEATIQRQTESGAIFSSFVNGDTSYGVAYADGSDGVVAGLSAGEFLIEPALVGDTDLNGTVNIHDLQNILGDFNAPGFWDQGNFDGHAEVDISDLQALLGNFNSSTTLSYSELSGIEKLAGQFGDNAVANTDGTGFTLVSVPEPASTMLLAVGFAWLARRRLAPVKNNFCRYSL
jgi:Polysaccharide lyase